MQREIVHSRGVGSVTAALLLLQKWQRSEENGPAVQHALEKSILLGATTSVTQYLQSLASSVVLICN